MLSPWKLSLVTALLISCIKNTKKIRIRKLHARSESAVEEKPGFKVDVRIGGIVDDVILKDEERMGKIQEVVENRGKAHTRNLFGKI